MFQNVSGLHLQSFSEFTSTSCVKIVATLILLRIPQRTSISRSSGLRKCKRIPQVYVDSVDNLRIPPTICGVRLQLAESAYLLRILLAICGFHLELRILRQLKFTKLINNFLLLDSINWFQRQVFKYVPKRNWTPTYKVSVDSAYKYL